MDRPVIDHRGPEFAQLVGGILPGVQRVFKTASGRVVLYPTSGTGAWEAALVNVLRPGDRVLAFSHGHFSRLFNQTARNLGYEVDEVGLEWSGGVPAEVVEERLRADGSARDRYKAVLVVHNETSTGVTSDVQAVRRAIDSAGHEALLVVDTVSSLASIDFRLDEWGVDLALTGSQKGLMLPPGMGLLCVGSRALEAGEHGGSPRNFFDWRPILEDNASGFYPYTPATLLLFGLREALAMLFEEGLDNVFARHHRLASGVRAAVHAWGLSILCKNPREYSNTLTAVVMPDGYDSQMVIDRARDNFGLDLGVGLGQIRGRVFRIGHLGALNELEVLAALAGVEMALVECGLPVRLGGGVEACQRVFVGEGGGRKAEVVRPSRSAAAAS
jgi:alanine-glyoxylate transaminase / serine-glyoxylate transaminase / serine-pyruvate transaminase